MKIILPNLNLKTWSAFLSCMAATVGALAGTQASFYVSPSGSDTNPGTLGLPFQSVAKARDVVRTVNGNMTGDIVVCLRGGTYQFPSTLQLGPQDSGTNGYEVVYQAYPGETPILSGGTNVTGWTLYDSGKNIYRASVGTSCYSRQLYVNGVRATRARSSDGMSWTKVADG